MMNNNQGIVVISKKNYKEGDKLFCNIDNTEMKLFEEDELGTAYKCPDCGRIKVILKKA